MSSLFSSVSRQKTKTSLRTAPKGHESAVREVVCTSAWVARDRRVPRASPALSSRSQMRLRDTTWRTMAILEVLVSILKDAWDWYIYIYLVNFIYLYLGNIL